MAKEDMIEVKGGNFGTRWEIVATEKNGMKFTKDAPENYKEGYYVAVNEMTSKDGPFKIHSIQTVNPDKTLGEVFSISGGKVLDDKMSELKLNAFIGIEYMGRNYKKGYETNKHWSQTNSYHIFKVGQNPKAPTYAEACDASEKAGGATKTAVSTSSAQPVSPAQVAGGGNTIVDDDLPF